MTEALIFIGGMLWGIAFLKYHEKMNHDPEEYTDEYGVTHGHGYNDSRGG